MQMATLFLVQLLVPGTLSSGSKQSKAQQGLDATSVGAMDSGEIPLDQRKTQPEELASAAPRAQPKKKARHNHAEVNNANDMNSTQENLRHGHSSQINQDPNVNREDGEKEKSRGVEQNVSTSNESTMPSEVAAPPGIEEQSQDLSNGSGSVKIEAYDAYDDDVAGYTYFQVAVSNKDVGDPFDLSLSQKPTFRDIRLEIERLIKDGEPDFNLNSKWRFVCGDGKCVPLSREARWRLDRKELGILANADGSRKNPHLISIRELK